MTFTTFICFMVVSLRECTFEDCIRLLKEDGSAWIERALFLYSITATTEECSWAVIETNCFTKDFSLIIIHRCITCFFLPKSRDKIEREEICISNLLWVLVCNWLCTSVNPDFIIVEYNLCTHTFSWNIFNCLCKDFSRLLPALVLEIEEKNLVCRLEMLIDILRQSSEYGHFVIFQDNSACHVSKWLDRGLRTMISPFHVLQVQGEQIVADSLMNDVTTENI